MSEESTTPDLAALTRRLLEAGNRGDFDAGMSFFAPDAVWETPLGTFEGAAAIRGLFEDVLSLYEEWEVDAEEILDLGHGVVFGVLRQTARLVDSSGEVKNRYASVAIWTAGLIARQMEYMDIDEGRAAAERLAESRGW